LKNILVDLIRARFGDKTIVLLGFGREGQSTYSLLRKVFPGKMITIADMSVEVRGNPLLRNDRDIQFITGPEYLMKLAGFDVIFRSPGIPVWQMIDNAREVSGDHDTSGEGTLISRAKITSQTELFLECYSGQVIGVTGTKGKSTTSSLIHHIFRTAGREVLLAGNIGNPVFHLAGLITPQTTIVVELSSHQLEFLRSGPHIAVLLNFYQEHLDAYESYEAYRLAKINITKYQQTGDHIVFNEDDPQVTKMLTPFLPDRLGYPFSLQDQPVKGGFIRDGNVCFTDGKKVTTVWKIHQDRFLRGEHNLRNIMAAVNVAVICGIETEMIEDGIATFKGLKHRLEYVGEFAGIHFYDDSISTIPEACIEAIRALPDVDTLVAGGFDRGIDYSGLAEFLAGSQVRNLIFVGAAGKRIMEHLAMKQHPGKRIFQVSRFDDFAAIAFRETRPGCTCLLSPAAASYDEFRNFEERGKRFRELINSEIAK